MADSKESPSINGMNHILPADAAEDDAFVICLRNFLRRCTPSDLERLLPEVRKRKCWTTNDVLSAVETAIDSKNTLEKHEYDKGVWSDENFMTGTSEDDVFDWICNLTRTIEQLKPQSKLEFGGYRICCLLYSFAMEKASKQIKVLGLGSGCKIETAIRKHMDSAYKVDPTDLKKVKKKSKTYRMIADKWGIGSLLAIGSRKTVWESLTPSSFDEVHSRITGNHHEVFCKLDDLAIKAAIDGLHAYGWPDSAPIVGEISQFLSSLKRSGNPIRDNPSASPEEVSLRAREEGVPLSTTCKRQKIVHANSSPKRHTPHTGTHLDPFLSAQQLWQNSSDQVEPPANTLPAAFGTEPRSINSTEASALVVPIPYSVCDETTKSYPRSSCQQVCKARDDLNPMQEKIFLMIHLCTMIECPVSKSLLLAAGQLRNRWSSNGFIEQFRITELGLDQDIVEALRHQSDVDNLISYYQDVGLVKECQDKKSGEIDVVSIVNSTTKVPTATPVQWNRIMVLACFFFTGCCEYESGVRNKSLRALPLFCELVERHAGFVEDRPTPVIMRALLQASKFGDNKWKSRSIQIAKTARPEDITIDDQAYLAYRQSFVLRSEGQEKEARRVVEEALQVLSSCSELGPVLNAIYGLLLSSLSWTYIAQGQFEKAINVFSSWTAGATGCERRPEQKLVMIRGIASKHLGKLDDAIHDLEAVSGVSISRARLYVLANLGDAYCEKGQSEVAYKMLSSAAKVAGCNLPNTPLNDTYHRTLLLSLSEACSYLGRYDESNEILRRLKDHFEQKRCTAGNDKQKHVRVLILLAQNQHRHATDPAAWVDTRDMWYESIRLTTEYQILSTSGWDYAVMCLSLYHALKMAWEEEKNGTWLQKASNIFSSGVQDHFWMRTLPTYWVPYMLEQDLGISDALRSCIESCRKLS